MIDKSNKKIWDKFAKLYAPFIKKIKRFIIKFVNILVLI